MLDTRRPFTRSDALAAGVPASLLRGSRFRTIFRGVYVDAAVVPSPIERTEAALLLFCAPARASHTSAARVYDVPVPVSAREHISVPGANDRRQRDGIVCHVSRETSCRRHRGVRVSTPETMFVELAQMLELVDLVVVGDNLVRKGLATTASLCDAARSANGVDGRQAQAAAVLVRAGVDSPMETRLRLLLILAGCPEPQVNASLRGPDGGVLRRYDLSWPTARLIVEYDGRHHIEREPQWQKDIDRRHAIEDDGWRLIVVTAHGIYRDPAHTIALVMGALRQRGQPGLPSRALADWRHHFR